MPRKQQKKRRREILVCVDCGEEFVVRRDFRNERAVIHHCPDCKEKWELGRYQGWKGHSGWKRSK